jgi:hypothetical protein
MAAKKQPVKQEPFLNTVARKLGQAAGTLTKVTQELTENLSTFPESVATKMRKAAANSGTPGKRSRVRTRHPRKRIHRLTRRPKTKGTATVEKRRLPKDKSPRSKRKPINMKA